MVLSAQLALEVQLIPEILGYPSLLREIKERGKERKKKKKGNVIPLGTMCFLVLQVGDQL